MTRPASAQAERPENPNPQFPDVAKVVDQLFREGQDQLGAALVIAREVVAGEHESDTQSIFWGVKMLIDQLGGTLREPYVSEASLEKGAKFTEQLRKDHDSQLATQQDEVNGFITNYPDALYVRWQDQSGADQTARLAGVSIAFPLFGSNDQLTSLKPFLDNLQPIPADAHDLQLLCDASCLPITMPPSELY